jgi:phage tail sheath protein FI
MANYTFPGVYILELSSPVHTITAAPTSIAAFVGYTMSGIDNRAQAIFSYGDFQRLYGGLASNSEVSYAVQQFYAIAGSGSQAYVVRTPMHYASPTAVVYAEVAFGSGQGGSALTFSALSSGQWANGQLLIDVDVIGLNLVAANGGDPVLVQPHDHQSHKRVQRIFPAAEPQRQCSKLRGQCRQRHRQRIAARQRRGQPSGHAHDCKHSA